MCGRYIGNDDDEVMSLIFQNTQLNYPNAVLKRGEIFPSDTAPILFGPDLYAVPARWGFPAPYGSGLLINARSETAAEKETFRESLMLRRCVVPTTGYYEWDTCRRKFALNRPEGGMLYLAGICRRFADGGRFAVLTTRPNDSVRPIHDRMPVISGTDTEDLVRWNTDTQWALDYLRSPMPALQAKEA